MKPSLQRKCNLLAQNAKTVMRSARLDFVQASNLGALIFTGENLVANERDIRANRKLLKASTSVVSNMRGPAVNLALLARMCIKPDALSYLNDVLTAYDAIKGSRIWKEEALAFTAITMVEGTPAANYRPSADEAWKTLDKMRSAHPLLTNQQDLTLAYLLNQADIDVDALLEEAETIYDTLKSTGFKLNKDTLQSTSIILALSNKPIDEKCQRFVELRNALRKAGRRISGIELSILAAFVDVDMSIDEIVSEVAEADDFLKHQRGFGLLSGGNLRRMYASSLVLQAYAEENPATDIAANHTVSESVTSTIILQIIMTIILLIIMTETAQIAASSAH